MRGILRPEDSSREQRRLVIGGQGGMGKTQLAIAFATQYYQEDSSVLWFDASSKAAMNNSFRMMAEAIFDTRDPATLADERSIIHTKRWLSDRRNTRWLLIFDNYDDPESYDVKRYYPDVVHGSIIVTTRRPDLLGGRSIRLQPLQRMEDQLEILETRSERQDVKSDQHARKLAERLAGLPLALATAGAYLRRSTFSFERYLLEYEQSWNVDHHWPAKLPEYEQRTLYTTWDVSYKRLKSEDERAAQLLSLLAYFSNRRLWYELFQAGLSDDLPRWLFEVASSDSALVSTMGRLTDYCFLEVQASTNSWTMHMCVHDWTFATLNQTIDKTRYAYAFDCVGALVEQEEPTSLDNVRLTDLAAHALRLEYICRHHSEAMEDIVPARLSRVRYIADLLRQQVQLAAAEKMYMRALQGYEGALGAKNLLTLDTIHNLGLLHCDQGKLKEAEEMYVRALEGKEEVLGAKHPWTLDTVNNLGLLHRNQGKLKEAEEMLVRALQGKEQALGAKHTSTLITVNNLGNLYFDQGKLKEADEMYVRALQGYEEALGTKHTASTVITVNKLGPLYWNPNKLKEAEETYVRALQGSEEALGAKHPGTLDTENNLGLLYKDQDKLKEAEEMYVRSLQGYEEALVAIPMSILSIVNNLGLLYWNQGKLKEAEKMYVRALQGREEALGAKHTSTLDIINNLGLLYKDQGKLEEAEEMFMRALQGYEEALGAKHPSTLGTVINLGNLYFDQGKIKETEEMYVRALQGYEEALGAKHTSTLTAINNLGLFYCSQDKLKDGEEMFVRALKGFEEALGAKHPSTLDTVENLGLLYKVQGKLEEAEEMYSYGF
ncbi:hypothetical protein KC330_g9210 [Hortaea werneckii]|nr:hypothetical protein KC330_g9210 [Hortaea werneckii]